MIDLALSLASRFAPGLVRRLAGEQAGDVAERIVGLARSVTGAQSPEDIERELAENAGLLHQFRMQAAQLDLEIEQAYLADRSNARDMRLELARMGKTDWMMYGVGGVVVLGFVATVLTAFLVSDLTPEQRNLVFSLAGLLGAMSSQVVSYFFGSSRGSSQKTAMMAAQGGRDGQSS